jgi:hypothetical protein
MQKESAAAGQFEVSTEIQGFGVSIGQASGDANATADLSTNVLGVNVNVQNLANTDRFISASADIAGFSLNVERQKTATGVNTGGSITTIFGTETQVFELTSVMIDVEDTAGITQDDGILGDISNAQSGKTISGAVLSTNTPMGMITGKYIDKNDLNTFVAELERGVMEYSYTKTENTDGVISASITVTF